MSQIVSHQITDKFGDKNRSIMQHVSTHPLRWLVLTVWMSNCNMRGRFYQTDAFVAEQLQNEFRTFEESLILVKEAKMFWEDHGVIKYIPEELRVYAETDAEDVYEFTGIFRDSEGYEQELFVFNFDPELN